MSSSTLKRSVLLAALGVSTLGMLSSLPVFAGGAAALEPLPSYQAGYEALQAEMAKPSDMPPLSAQDKQVMEAASAQLAAQMPDPGLKVGARAPDFTLVNARGEDVRLAALLQRGPVVLTFYRGAWCPYCNLQLRQLRESLPHFQRHGAQLVAVTPQRPDKSLGQVEQDGYPFEILSDLDSEVMRAYNLYFEVPQELSELHKRNFDLDLADYNGAGRYVLPVPGTFIIDTRGIIRGAFADTDYRKRMEPAEILHVIETMPSVRIQ